MSDRSIAAVPLRDLGAHYLEIGAVLEAAVLAVVRSGHYILGPEVEALEREIAAHSGCEHGIAVSKCIFGQNCHVANDVVIGSNVKV